MKNSKKSSKKQSASWDLEEAISVAEFFENHDVEEDAQRFKIKEITAENGNTFFALGLANGEDYTDDKGKVHEGRGMTFFALGLACAEANDLEDASLQEVRSFVKAHKSEITLLEPIEGETNFGKFFIGGGGELWEDL